MHDSIGKSLGSTPLGYLMLLGPGQLDVRVTIFCASYLRFSATESSNFDTCPACGRFDAVCKSFRTCYTISRTEQA
jgi:hypothetical protein